jgi:hypothetical protein
VVLAQALLRLDDCMSFLLPVPANANLDSAGLNCQFQYLSTDLRRDTVEPESSRNYDRAGQGFRDLSFCVLIGAG